MALTQPKINFTVKMRIAIVKERCHFTTGHNLRERRTLDRVFQCGDSLSLGNSREHEGPAWVTGEVVRKECSNECERTFFSKSCWLLCMWQWKHLPRWLWLILSTMADKEQSMMQDFMLSLLWIYLHFLPGSLETYCFEPNKTLEW